MDAAIGKADARNPVSSDVLIAYKHRAPHLDQYHGNYLHKIVTVRSNELDDLSRVVN